MKKGLDRRLLSKILCLCLVFAWSQTAYGEVLRGTQLLSQWEKELRPVSPETLEMIRKRDPEALKPDTRPEDVLEVDIDSYRRILEKITRSGWRPLELYAHPFFAKTPKVLYFPHDVVRVTSNEYDVSTVFFTHGFTGKNCGRGENYVPKGTFFDVQGYLLGNGRVVILYPFHICAHRDDPLFGFLTGNYEMYRFNVVDIESVEGGPLILKNFRGRDEPHASFQSVKAPMEFPIRAMKVHPAKRNKVEVFFYTGWFFAHPRIAKIEPALYTRKPEESRIPESFLFGTARLADTLRR